MKLSDLLAADRVVLGIAGSTVREAAGPLVDAIVAAGRAGDPDALEAFLADSLPREAVTVGQQAFLLHFRTDAVSSVTAAIGVTTEPVHREHDPVRESRIVLLIAAPAGETSLYLRVVGAFARALAREDVATGILAAGTPEVIAALPALGDVEVPTELLVRDVMPPGHVSVGQEATLAEAARLLMRHGLPWLPVVSDEGLVMGRVGYRELLRHVLPHYTKRLSGEHRAMAGDPMEVLVRDAMDRSVLCISEEQSLTDTAAMLVNKNLERVPVVRDGALVGLLTRETIVRQLLGR